MCDCLDSVLRLFLLAIVMILQCKYTNGECLTPTTNRYVLCVDEMSWLELVIFTLGNKVTFLVRILKLFLF